MVDIISIAGITTNKSDEYQLFKATSITYLELQK